MSANEQLFDAANRHQTFLIRYGGSSANAAVKLLEKAEKDLVARIAKRVSRLGPSAKGNLQSKRLRAILSDIRQQTRDLTTALHGQTRKELMGLAKQEVGLASRRIGEAVGVDLNNFRVPPETLRTLVDKRAVGGKSLRRWFTRLGSDRVGRLEAAVNMGVLEGDTLGQITQRFRDAEQVTQRSAKALVRTHVTHVANQSREALYEANSDIVEELRWTSTLDGRTSSICQSRDGNTYEIDDGPRPPAHPNCRSIMTPVMKSWAKLAKPGAMKPGRGAGNIDRLFKKNLKKQGFKADEIAKIKRNTRASMNGQVPADLTYNDWLKRQPKGFQNDVLGKTRGDLFREGGLSVDKFVDQTTGRGYTLDTIRDRNEEAWMAAHPQKPGVLSEASTLHSMESLMSKGNDIDPSAAKDWNNVFNDTPDNVFGRMFKGTGFAPDVQRWRGGGAPGFRLRLRDKDGNAVADMTRIFRKDGAEVSVKHASFSVDEAHRGVGKTILRNAMTEYQNIGVTKVSLSANIDVGSYAWAKYGFKPFIPKAIQADLRFRLPSIKGLAPDDLAELNRIIDLGDDKMLWEISDMKIPVEYGGEKTTLGKALLLNQQWDGVLDLADSEAMGRFWRYVGK